MINQVGFRIFPYLRKLPSFGRRVNWMLSSQRDWNLRIQKKDSSALRNLRYYLPCSQLSPEALIPIVCPGAGMAPRWPNCRGPVLLLSVHRLQLHWEQESNAPTPIIPSWARWSVRIKLNYNFCPGRNILTTLTLFWTKKINFSPFYLGRHT